MQILVNESYEQFVARPLVPSSDLSVARKYAKKELFVSHILIGHSGAYLSSPPQRTLDEALLLSKFLHTIVLVGLCRNLSEACFHEWSLNDH